MTRQTVIAYWLIPSQPARSFFHGIINELASRYNAPVFEPHVTIHVGADDAASAKHGLENATAQRKVIGLRTLAIHHSSSFVKTLFVQFATSAELRQINKCIRDAGNDSCQYELNPHLSLLYKKLPARTRSKLAFSITLPFSEVHFDSLQAIRCVSPARTGADVNAWELIASRIL